MSDDDEAQRNENFRQMIGDEAYDAVTAESARLGRKLTMDEVGAILSHAPRGDGELDAGAAVPETKPGDYASKSIWDRLVAAEAALATAKGEVEKLRKERDEANRQLTGNARFRTGHPLTEQAITRLNGLREYDDLPADTRNAILDRLEDLVRMLGFDAEHANDILEQTESALSTAKGERDELREALALCRDALQEWEDDPDTSGTTMLHQAAKAQAKGLTRATSEAPHA